MTDQNPYSGPERRIGQRRKIVDRRNLIRFEPDMEPRRNGHGRRKGERNAPWKQTGV